VNNGIYRLGISIDDTIAGFHCDEDTSHVYAEMEINGEILSPRTQVTTSVRAVRARMVVGPGSLVTGAAGIAGGRFNRARGAYSVVAGGGGPTELDSNSAIGDYSTVGGGNRNIAGVTPTSLKGTREASALFTICSTVGGGCFNTASAFSTVSGGFSNTASSSYSTVSGGLSNTASSDYSTVSGGKNNVASGEYATVAGGEFGEAIGIGSTVSGGFANEIDSNYGAIGGGTYNSVTHEFATVAGGGSNIASGRSSTIGGGSSNRTSGKYSTVAGGINNIASDTAATVGGGENNVASGNHATLGGGENNTASGERSTISGGQDNIASGKHATIPGGLDNAAQGSYSFVAGRRAKANFNGSVVISASQAANASDSISDGGQNQMVLRANAGLYITLGQGPATYDLTKAINTSSGAYLTVGGTWTNSSDRNKKENFTPVDGKELLEKLSQLPISMWNYKSDSKDVKHIGPIAQDFFEIFHLGSDEKAISTIDPSGIALATIKQLHKENQDLKDRLQKLEVIVKLLASQKKEAGGESLGELK